MALFLHICSSHFRLQSGPEFRRNTTFSSFFLLDARMGGVGLSLVHFSRASRSNLKLTSLTIRFLPFTKHHGDSVAVINAVVLVPGCLPLTRAFQQHSPSSPFLLSLPSSSMKLVFEIKTEPVTQASIIIAVVAFSSGALASIAAYSDSPSVCVACAIVLAVIVYSALRLAPR